MIDIKIGETYTTPGGVVIKAIHGKGCGGCAFSLFFGDLSMRERAGIGCSDMDCRGGIFIEVTKHEEAPAPSIPLPTLSGMDDAFKRHVLSVARAEFAALFWDMPNTDLAAAIRRTV